MRTTFNQLPSSQSISIAFKSFPPAHQSSQEIEDDRYFPAENNIHKRDEMDRIHRRRKVEKFWPAKPDRVHVIVISQLIEKLFFSSLFSSSNTSSAFADVILCIWTFRSIWTSSDHHQKFINIFSLSFRLHCYMLAARCVFFPLTIQFILLNHKEKSSQFYLTASLFL